MINRRVANSDYCLHTETNTNACMLRYITGELCFVTTPTSPQANVVLPVQALRLLCLIRCLSTGHLFCGLPAEVFVKRKKKKGQGAERIVFSKISPGRSHPHASSSPQQKKSIQKFAAEACSISLCFTSFNRSDSWKIIYIYIKWSNFLGSPESSVLYLLLIS